MSDIFGPVVPCECTDMTHPVCATRPALHLIDEFGHTRSATHTHPLTPGTGGEPHPHVTAIAQLLEREAAERVARSAK